VRSSKPSAEYAEQLRRLLFVAEQYYNRPLSQTEQDMLAWLLCDLKMDPDVIEYLLEYCISQGHTSSRYMEKVAQGWHSEGIRTVEEARQQGIHGKESTPFLLARIKDLTGGDSLDSNIQLVYNNARLAAKIATAYTRL
jgi:DnaD/phage-associated family protein